MSQVVNSFRKILVLTVLVILLGGAKANAELTHFDVSFNVNGFASNGGGAVPVNPVIGSFGVTFDPTLTLNNISTGLTLNSLNLNMGAFNGGLGPRFNYNSSTNTFAFLDGLISSGTNGIILTLNNFTSASA